ncbi:MAG: fibrobacter succinogenes major paralogous domain-containing protein, partial [Bacteroidia bacterium]|nr:fibrobacter succinogenes major paralogous domain-containing protein [Bacteroidia bacterium]
SIRYFRSGQSGFRLVSPVYSDKSQVIEIGNHELKPESSTLIVSVTDRDGNVYKTVTIGTQVWMAENLKTTKFNDGSAIPLVTDDKTWDALTTPAYCWCENDATANKNTYGASYNWYTVGTNKLCLKGWHVPTDAEWTTLTTYLGGESVAGGKLKETGTTHWESPNTGATNESGFTALPSGYRNNHGAFANVGYFGFWWSATENVATATTASWCRSMGGGGSDVLRFPNLKKNGYSVRCLRD